MVSFYPQPEEYFWVYPKDDPEFRDKIVKEFKIHPVTAEVLISRGFTDLEAIHDFLYAKLPDLHDPFLMPDMETAVQRVMDAIDRKEGILIYGDNDVDGMTGTALLADFLNYVGGKAYPYASTRSVSRDHLMVEALSAAEKNGCRLIITVDCGVSAEEELREVKIKGIDVIVTDHHEPTDKIPHCLATLNPKLIGSTYPNRELTGVGVAFKLAHGVTSYLSQKEGTKKIDLKRYLDLVALGTVADMGVLQGENRILVRYGLKTLRRTKRVGLVKLADISEIDLSEVTAQDIVFKLAPRLNSLGRIDDPQKGVQLLLTKSIEEANDMAKELDLNNMERQRIERLVSHEVEELLFGQPAILQQPAIALSSSNWHPGVIAILSTRLTKLYNRPSVLLAIEGGMGKGSLRSIPEFPLLPVLKQCSGLLESFGGHDLAAGLTIQEGKIEEFKTFFLALAKKVLKPEDVQNRLLLDAKVDFKEITFDLLESNRLLEPYGNGNPPPLFYAKAKQPWSPKPLGRSHLRLFLEQDDRVLEGIVMNRASLLQFAKDRRKSVEVAFTPDVGLFQKGSIQLLVKDFR